MALLCRPSKQLQITLQRIRPSFSYDHLPLFRLTNRNDRESRYFAMKTRNYHGKWLNLLKPITEIILNPFIKTVFKKTFSSDSPHKVYSASLRSISFVRGTLKVQHIPKINLRAFSCKHHRFYH